MVRHLRKLFLLLVVASIPAGFHIEHEHAVFLWHAIPSVDALFGCLGALLLMLAVRIVGPFTYRKEDFYD